MNVNPLMYFKQLLFFLFIFLSIYAWAIPVNIDSVKQVASSQANSRDKADNLYAVMRTYFQSGNYDSSWVYSEKLFAIASGLDYRERMADALYTQSTIRENYGEISEALPLISHYLQIVKPLNDSLRLAKGYVVKARALKDQGQIDSAISLFRENIKMGMAMPDTMMLIVTSNEMGNIYQDLNVFDSAAHYYLESGRLCESSGRQQHLGNIYNNLGKTFMRMKQFDEARKYLEMSLDINKQKNNQREIALSLTNLGGIYLESGDLQNALKYYDQAFEIYKSYDRVFLEVADLYNNYAEIYEQQENFSKALEYLKKANDIYSSENYVEGMTISLLNMGNIYTAQGMFDQAQVVLDSSLALAYKTGSKINQKKALWAMSHNYFESGNYRKAYEYYDQYHKVNNEIYEIERTNKINELNIQYNNEKIQKENLALKNQNLEMELELRKKTYQSNFFLFTGIGIVVLGLFLSLYLRQRITISKQKIFQLEEEKKLIAAKLLVEGQEQERKRIATDLHDGLGVLLSATKMQFSNIRDKSPENSQFIEKAMQLLDQATGDVRKISHNMMPGLLTKLGLYEAVEDLFENIEDSQVFIVHCDIGNDLERLPENKEIMLYRVIQEWVNNTFKHARAGKISMTMSADKGILNITYSDDGVGFDFQSVTRSETESLGLKSIQSRVNFLDGTLSVDSSPGNGVRYHLSMPL